MALTLGLNAGSRVIGLPPFHHIIMYVFFSVTRVLQTKHITYIVTENNGQYQNFEIFGNSIFKIY